MMRYPLTVSLLLSLFALPAHADPRPAPVVYVAGDSIVAGNYLWSPPRDGFVPRLANRLCGQDCGRPGHPTVISVARGGQRLVGMLESQWQSILDATPAPTTIIIAIGVNDLGLVADETWAEAYRQLARRAEGRGIRIIPCTIAPTNDRWASRSRVVQQWYRLNFWLTAYFGASAVADFSVIGRPTDPAMLDLAYDNYPRDGVHPDPYGVMRLADAIPLGRVM